MGTSASKGDAAPGSPLIPPWANEDPVVPPDDADEDQKDAEPTEEGEKTQRPPPPPQSPPTPPRPFNAFRRNLTRYVETGDRGDARSALGHWASTARGGARTGTQRVSRAIRSGGAALAALARTAAGEPPTPGELDIGGLAGIPANTAIARIVDAFCPPGILDEDALRAALGEALAEAVGGEDNFDPAALDANAVRIAMLRFVAELVFVSVMMDSGDALAAVLPAVAIQRENNLRNLIREVADVVGTPLLEAAGVTVTTTGVRDLVARLVFAVQGEMASWE
jgi:hypothetical protein